MLPSPRSAHLCDASTRELWLEVSSLMRLVVDSSVVIAAVQTGEALHAEARAFVDRLRAASNDGLACAFAPPELWLEVHVVEQRLARSRRGASALGPALDGLA